jgi:4-hydroxy-4-methyl-2-oxoglutarate aldolase
VIGTALLASAGGDRVKVILGLEPVFPEAHALGRALTVRSAAADSLGIHHAIAVAQPGDVIVSLGFPVFHLGTSPRGPGKAGPGELRVPVELGGVQIEPGDLVCADADGVAVVAAAHADQVRAAAEALEERERGMVSRIEGGESTVEILGLKELS